MSVESLLFKWRGQNVAVKSGTAQIASENGYLEVRMTTSIQLCAMTPAENPEFIMYVTVQQPEEKFQPIFLAGSGQSVLEEASLSKTVLI